MCHNNAEYLQILPIGIICRGCCWVLACFLTICLFDCVPLISSIIIFFDWLRINLYNNNILNLNGPINHSNYWKFSHAFLNEYLNLRLMERSGFFNIQNKMQMMIFCSLDFYFTNVWVSPSFAMYSVENFLIFALKIKFHYRRKYYVDAAFFRLNEHCIFVHWFQIHIKCLGLYR